jgi:hypothetical protein
MKTSDVFVMGIYELYYQLTEKQNSHLINLIIKMADDRTIDNVFINYDKFPHGAKEYELSNYQIRTEKMFLRATEKNISLMYKGLSLLVDLRYHFNLWRKYRDDDRINYRDRAEENFYDACNLYITQFCRIFHGKHFKPNLWNEYLPYRKKYEELEGVWNGEKYRLLRKINAINEK